MSAVTDVVRSYVPASYRAMCSVTNTYFQLSYLEEIADAVKQKLMATTVSHASEATVYDSVLLRFMGKLTTIAFIPAAVDFWGDHLLQKTSTGTSETQTYPDRRDGLWKIFDDLMKETDQEFKELAPLYGFRIYGTKGMIPKVTYGDNGRGILITADPQLFGGLKNNNVWNQDPLNIPWGTSQ